MDPVDPRTLPDETVDAEPTAASPEGPPRELPGGRYERHELLGRGGMGEVWRGLDLRLGRVVAIKIARSDRLNGSTFARFEREASTTARLQHPGIPPVFDQGVLPDGRPWFALKLIEGHSLTTVIARERAAALSDPANAGVHLDHLVGHLVRVADTLGCAHAAGVVHRDLKPDNVMIGAFGEVAVLDWGLASLPGNREQDESLCEDEPGLTRAGAVMGTPAWCAPEQAAGQPAGPSADVFAMGAILYACLAGEAPFPGSRTAVPPPPPERFVGHPAPKELRALIARAMHPQPELRHADGAALRADLAAYTSGRPLAGRRYGPLDHLRMAARRNRGATRVALGALGLGILLVPLGLVAWNHTIRIEAQRAQDAEMAMRAALAEQTLATGLAELAAGEVVAARNSLVSAHTARLTLGLDPFPTELGAQAAYRESAPLARFLLEPGVRIAISSTGARLLTATPSGRTELRLLPAGPIIWETSSPGPPLDLGFRDDAPWVLARVGDQLWRIGPDGTEMLGAAGDPETSWLADPQGTPRLSIAKGVEPVARLHTPTGEQPLAYTHVANVLQINGSFQVFTSGYRNPAYLWAAETGERLRTVCPNICRIGLDPTHRRLAVFDEFTQELRVEPVEGGKAQWRVPWKAALQLAWTPDTLWLAGNSHQLSRLWASDGTPREGAAGHTREVQALVVGTNYAVSVDRSGEALVWSTSSPTGALRAEKPHASSWAFSNDGELVALGTPEQVRVFSLALSREVACVRHPLGDLQGLNFSADNQEIRLWTAGMDQGLHPGALTLSPPEQRHTPTAHGLQGGRRLHIGPAQWHLEGTEGVVWRIPAPLVGVIWEVELGPAEPGGMGLQNAIIWVSGWEDRTVLGLDATSGQIRHRWTSPEEPYGLAHVPGGGVIWGTRGGGVLIGEPGAEPRRLGEHEGAATDVAIDPSGRWVSSVGYDGALRIWDLWGEEPPRIDRSAQGPLFWIHWLDARRFVTYGIDGILRTTDLDFAARATGAQGLAPQWEDQGAWDAAVSARLADPIGTGGLRRLALAQMGGSNAEEGAKNLEALPLDHRRPTDGVLVAWARRGQDCRPTAPGDRSP